MRLARKKATPALPQTLIALADFLDVNPDRYKCCERPFYQERIVDGLGKCSIIFGCEELVNGSLMRNIRRKGLTTYLKHSHEAQMSIKMFAALALLPANQIEEGYQCIRQHARNNNLQITSFFNYFNSFWLRTVGPETFSVHGIARRTNNNVENFHGRLKEKFQTSHPNL
uniref:MULE transposase domain-containing protein n=1 Tax=Schizaphis graminum TaxID=13262 RepID=A0A2S2NGI5_SCHGA